MVMSLKQNKFNPKISVLTELDLEIKNKEKKWSDCFELVQCFARELKRSTTEEYSQSYN